MVVSEFYKTRKDGVNLYKRIDALVDETGKPMRDSEGKLIPTGFKIRKVGTDEFYSEAIDVENAPWSYVETDVPCEKAEDLLQ